MNAASMRLADGRVTPATRGAINLERELPGVRLIVASHAPAAKIGWHSHPVANIAVVLRGTLCERLRGAAHAMTGGDAVFKPAGERHSNAYGPGGASTLLLELYGGDGHALPSRPRLVRSRQAMGAAALYRALTARVASSAHLLEELAWSLVASFDRDDDSTPPPSPWLARVRLRLADEWRHPPSLVDLAAREGVHPAHLIRAFGRAFGTSPGAWVRERRVQAARQAIVVTPEPLAHIAVDCGYSDQSHLCRDITRRFGCPPSALRRRSGGRPPGADGRSD